MSYSGIGFKTKQARNSNSLSISYDTENPAQGKMIMGELLKQVMEYYRNRIDTGRGAIDNSISMMKNQNTTNENKKMRITNEKKKIMSNMELLREKADLLKITEKNFNTQLKGVEENTKVIMQERNEMLKKGEKVDSVALLLYSNTVQQNISYINSLNADLDRNRLEQESTKNELSKAEIELKNKDTELKDVDTEILNNLDKIRNLELDKMRIEGIRVVQEPYASIKPVKPNKKKNIAIAGVTSLFLGIFLVFFLEFIKKVKTYPDTHSESETKG
jgi:capsular polysaccharide biosynthesis protein